MALEKDCYLNVVYAEYAFPIVMLCIMVSLHKQFCECCFRLIMLTFLTLIIIRHLWQAKILF
jgi:hypothetical protein